MKSEKSLTNYVPLEENLKKALTELLLLHLLNIREYFIGELTQTLSEHTGGTLRLAFPYSAVYRLQQSGYIAESEKRIASDGRRRQFYHITEQGRKYYSQLIDAYCTFICRINGILNIDLS